MVDTATPCQESCQEKNMKMRYIKTMFKTGIWQQALVLGAYLGFPSARGMAF